MRHAAVRFKASSAISELPLSLSIGFSWTTAQKHLTTASYLSGMLQDVTASVYEQHLITSSEAVVGLNQLFSILWNKSTCPFVGATGKVLSGERVVFKRLALPVQRSQ